MGQILAKTYWQLILKNHTFVTLYANLDPIYATLTTLIACQNQSGTPAVWIFLGMSGLASKWVSLAQNRTNLGLFNRRESPILSIT